MKKKWLAVLVSSFMALSVVGCSSASTSTPSTPETKTESTTTTSAPAEEKKTEETPTADTGRDVSGTVVLYSSMTDDDIDCVIEGFEALYPDVSVEVVNGSAGELCARITAESANPQGDVMLGGINQADGDRYKDIFEPYISPFEDDIYEDYHSNNGYYNYDHLSSVVFCVNTELEAKLGLDIKDYDDLLDPSLAGKVVISDPNESSAAWNNLSNIMAIYGNDSDESWDLVEKLMQNKMIITSSSSVCFKAVADGEYVVGLTYEDGASTLLKSGATNVKVVYPESGSSSFAFGCAVIQGAPNMEAAKALVDYLMDAESQTARGNLLGTIRMTNKNADINYQYIPDTDEVNWVTRDIEWLIENKSQVLEHWNSLYAKYY